MAEDYKDKGFIIVGAHSQEGTREQVVQLAKDFEINYTILSGASVKGSSASGLPYCYLFDADGKCVYNGRDAGKKLIEETLDKAPDWILGPNDYEHLKKEAGSVLSRKGLGKTMATLRELKDGEGDDSAEAARMFERLDRYASAEWARVEGLRTSRPSQYQAELKEFSKVWKDDELGDRADEAFKAVKGDDAFKDAVTADGILIQIEATLDEAKPCKFGQPVELKTCRECQEKNSKVVSKVAVLSAQVVKKYGETPAAKAVQDLIAAHGIPHSRAPAELESGRGPQRARETAPAFFGS